MSTRGRDAVGSICITGKRNAYARRMGQPTQRATNYTARSNMDTAQIFLHANGQRPNRAMIRQRSRRRQRRGEPHTEHGLGVLLLFACKENSSLRSDSPLHTFTDGKVCSLNSHATRCLERLLGERTSFNTSNPTSGGARRPSCSSKGLGKPL